MGASMKEPSAICATLQSKSSLEPFLTWIEFDLPKPITFPSLVKERGKVSKKCTDGGNQASLEIKCVDFPSRIAQLEDRSLFCSFLFAAHK